MDRRSLTDAQWAKMQPHCRGKVSDPGRTGGDNRLFLEAVLWIARTGSPWRDLPPEFGNWNTVFKRFCDWGLCLECGGNSLAAISEWFDLHLIRLRGQVSWARWVG
jgi:transposase